MKLFWVLAESRIDSTRTPLSVAEESQNDTDESFEDESDHDEIEHEEEHSMKN